MRKLERARTAPSEPIQHAICLAVLTACALVFYAPAIFTGAALVGSDTVSWRANAEPVLEYEEQTGRTALWATNTYGGMPAYMIHYPMRVPQLDDLPRWLRGLIWPASHLIFLLAGMYVFLFNLTRDKLAGMLSAVAFGFTTYVPLILIAGHNTKFIALCFVPWMAAAFAYSLRRPGFLAALLFAIALAINLRAKHVQITYCLTFLLGVWWLVEGVRAVRERQMKSFGRSTAWLALGSALGLLMVAQPYLAQAELKAFTTRGSGLSWSDAMAWSQGSAELITLIIADAFGGGGSTYWGPKTFTAGPHYVGGIVALLAVVALDQVRRPVVWAFGLGALLMTLFSLGSHLPWVNRFMHEAAPLYSAFRVPETWLSIVAFALAVLAGLGVHRARRADRADRRRLLVTSAGMVGFVLVFLVFSDVFLDFKRADEARQLREQLVAAYPDTDDLQIEGAVRDEMAGRIEQRKEAFSKDALRTMLFLLLAGAALFAQSRGVLPARLTQSILVLLVLVDLWGVDRRYVNEERMVTEEIAEQIPTYDFDRYIRKQAASPFRVLSLETGDPMLHARPSFHHQSLGGYHGAKLQRYQDFIDRLFVDLETGLPNEDALDMLNARYVVARGPLPNMRRVYDSEATDLVVLENPDVLPRAFFVGKARVIPSDEATWEYMQSRAFDPHDTAVLAAPIDFEAAPIDSSDTAHVEMLEYTAHQIRWQVHTDAPRLLVVSEVYYPAGWNAYVDGKKAAIHRANYLLRAVAIPEGEHTVEMRFEPRSHRLGVWISGISTAVVYGATLLLLGLAWRRRH